MERFVLVKIDYHYCDFLRKYDYRVPYNKDKKELRPFVGVIFKIGDIEYFAPLASPKPKHKKMNDSLDFIKIANGELGVINFNNMIPVLKSCYTLLDMDNIPNNKEDYNYYNLLSGQLIWLNNHRRNIIRIAKTLYQFYAHDTLSYNIKSRCCDFQLLEEKCLEYNQVLV